jgi:hypothetical protein
VASQPPGIPGAQTAAVRAADETFFYFHICVRVVCVNYCTCNLSMDFRKRSAAANLRQHSRPACYSAAGHSSNRPSINSSDSGACYSALRDEFVWTSASLEWLFLSVAYTLPIVPVQASSSGRRPAPGGVIANVASVAGRTATAPIASYAASKWALEALSERLAHCRPIVHIPMNGGCRRCLRKAR